jgi:hypothetical protein
MTPPAGHRPRDLPPHMRWLLPRLLLSTMVLGVATPVELAVPLIRTAQGRRGVQSGPVLGCLVSVAGVLALADRVEKHPEFPTPGEAAFTAALAAGAVLPAVASALPATVVFPRSSPLWGWALWLGGRLATAVVLAAGVRRQRPPEGDGDVGARP